MSAGGMRRTAIAGVDRSSPESPLFAADPAWPPGFARGAANRRALAVLLALPSLTARRLMRLASRHPSATACLAAVRRGGGASSDADRDRAGALDGDDLLRIAREAGARFVTAEDPEYPPRLLDLYDPPAALFVRGRPLAELDPAVAMVGARNCSDAGREVAEAIARALAVAGVCVVSGGARGVDAAGHRGSLDAGGRTLAVLGSGIDVPYPKQNAGLLERAASAGAVVSEYPPGTRAEPFRFPARNRLVAALAVGVVVVEGAAGSGSMITAEHAMDLGREVFAVPGPVTSELSHVPLSLIREGATMIRGAEDLLEDLGFRALLPSNDGVDPAAGSVPGDLPEESAEAGSEAGLPPDEARVLRALDAPGAIDMVARRASIPLPRVLSALVSLELRGLVRRVGGRLERTMKTSPTGGTQGKGG
jgi:DNA processing protein